MKFRNFTPHNVVLNDGTIFPSEGVARVSASFGEFHDGICSQKFGEIEGLPEPQKEVWIIVSAVVLAANNSKGILRRRTDLVAPATGHPECVRENGFIVSVPGFVR